MASNFYGQQRLTYDIDFVIMLSSRTIDAPAKRFPGTRYYLSPEAAKEAIDSGGMFNIIDSQSGLKADLWILDRSDRYRTASFERRREVVIFGMHDRPFSSGKPSQRRTGTRKNIK